MKIRRIKVESLWWRKYWTLVNYSPEINFGATDYYSCVFADLLRRLTPNCDDKKINFIIASCKR